MSRPASGDRPRTPLLVVFAGLPATGKTTMAHMLAQRLSATFLTVDAIEAAIWRAGILRQEATGLAAYLVAQTTAEGTLSAGTNVVADAVNPVEAARQAWRDAAKRTRSALRVVEMICSDASEHRRRVQLRRSDPTRRSVSSWNQILAQQYEPWPDSQPRLVLDTCRMTHTDCVDALDHYLSSSENG
jgi:predicted kinase